MLKEIGILSNLKVRDFDDLKTSTVKKEEIIKILNDSEGYCKTTSFGLIKN
jgi:hypothetical protein